VALRPLGTAEVGDKVDVFVTVSGGGDSGQAGAVSHGIARALLKFEPDLRSVLKKQGHLTRDGRERERKKPGQPGARKRFQFSKR
jgi:small subunit ribosomal protein S9